MTIMKLHELHHGTSRLATQMWIIDCWPVGDTPPDVWQATDPSPILAAKLASWMSCVILFIGGCSDIWDGAEYMFLIVGLVEQTISKKAPLGNNDYPLLSLAKAVIDESLHYSQNNDYIWYIEIATTLQPEWDYYTMVLYCVPEWPTRSV